MLSLLTNASRVAQNPSSGAAVNLRSDSIRFLTHSTYTNGLEPDTDE